MEIKDQIDEHLQRLPMPGVRRELCGVLSDTFVFSMEFEDNPMICWLRTPYTLNKFGEAIADFHQARVIQRGVKGSECVLTDFIHNHKN